jgi:SMI1 / KNR4 family (SUKH-1)
MSIVDQIKQNTGVQFRAASRQELEQLRALRMPPDLIEFYSKSAPVKMVEIKRVRLWPVSDLVVENKDAVPGYYIVPCGYSVFATNDCGDAYCFDTFRASGNTAPVVLIAHDLEPDDDKMVREDLSKVTKEIAESFSKFLEGFVTGRLDREPIYRPFDLEKGSNETA